MQSSGQRRGRNATLDNTPSRPLPREKIECSRAQRDEWVNCSTPQNEAAARAILREAGRERTRDRRERQMPTEHSRYEVPDLLDVPDEAEPLRSRSSPYALPQLAKRVAEMDAIREARGNPFPYPPDHPRHIPQTYPAPLFRQPSPDQSSRVEANFREHCFSPEASPTQLARISPTLSPRKKTLSAFNARQVSRVSKPTTKPGASKGLAARLGESKPRVVLRLPRRRKIPSPFIDVPENPFGHFGTIAGRDEVGPIFDYSNLVPNRAANTVTSLEAGKHGNNGNDCGSTPDFEDRQEVDFDKKTDDGDDDLLSQCSQDTHEGGAAHDSDDEIGLDSQDTAEHNYQTGIRHADPRQYASGFKEKDYEENAEEGGRIHYGQVTREEYPYIEMDEMSAGATARIRQLEEDQEDEGFFVNDAVPNTWGSKESSTSQQETSQTNSTNRTNSFAAPETDRSYAPAFAPRAQRRDPYQPHGQERSFDYAMTAPTAPRSVTWNSMPPPPSRRGSSSRTGPVDLNAPFSVRSQPDQTGLDVNAARNQALEGAFNSDSVVRVNEARDGGISAATRTDTLDGASQQSRLYSRELDHRLENPNLDIDPDVRANFVPFSQLYSAPKKRTAFEMQNPNLIATNRDAPISTVIGGETLTYTPRPMDQRVQSLDRHGNYIGENQGEISKRLKRQHVEKVIARDREMLEANRAYQALLAMTPQARTELLERLRKPFVFYGAFGADQQVTDEVPEVYTRPVSSVRLIDWIDLRSLDSQRAPHTLGAPASSTFSSNSLDNADDFRPFDDFGDLDDFAAGSSFVPLESRVQRQVKRTGQYFEDVVFFSRENSVQASPIRNPVQTQSSSQISSLSSRTIPSPRPQALQGFNLTDLALPSHHSDWTSGAQYNSPETRPGHPEVGASTRASSRGIDDPFTFDDSPEFQTPEDIDLECFVDLTTQQERLYRIAKSHSEKYGRVILIRLHEPVKFSPGAIAQRVFGGIVQEMQLFPTQRLAIVVFLHCAEAKAFLRHVKRTHEIGNAHEIRNLQIEAGWYKGNEKSSTLPIQPNILRHHISAEATRTLRLTHIDLSKSVSQVSSELGSRLSTMLLKVILTAPKQKYLQEEQGRQAIIEFGSVKDAILAKDKLDAGTITAYGSCGGHGTVAFAADPCARVAPQKSWCKCLGCQEQRAEKV